MDYWREATMVALEEAGISASDEQIEVIADWIEGAHENYGTATGHDIAFRGHESEIDLLRRELRREQEARWCPDCRGAGDVTISYLNRSSTSSCTRCGGKGKLYYAAPPVAL